MIANFKWWRRYRGGRWARVTGLLWGLRWVRMPDSSIEPCEEDYR